MQRGQPVLRVFAAVAIVALCLGPWGVSAQINTTQALALFNALDTNHDGVISKDEYQVIFTKSDKNGDGLLDNTEIDPTFIAQFDKNADGKLTLDEFMLSFDEFDKNKDGVLQPGELNAS